MNLNSILDFSVNQIQFEVGSGDRTINTNVPRSLYFIQNGGNARIQNNAAVTTHTFNVNVNINAGTWLEIRPELGFLVFNNPVVNNSGNTIHIWGNQQVTFNGDIMSSLGTPGLTVNGNATTVYIGVSKTYLGTTTINSGGTLRISSNQSLGAITLNAGGNLIVDAGSTLTINGAWTGGGTIQNNGTIVLAGTAAQNFPGVGTTVSAMNNLTINNTAGVNLDRAMTVTGNLVMTNGILTTSGANLLTVSNTATTAISGGSTTSFINGPVLWNLPSNLVAGSTYVFPVGKGGTYYPISVIDPTTGAGVISLRAEAFTGSSGGTAGPSLTSISPTEYWSLISTGNLTNHRVSLTRQIPVGVNNRIGRSNTTANGVYNGIGGTAAGNSINNSNLTSAGPTQFFVMALAGPINVTGAAAVTNGDYANLQAAFAAINATAQGGNSIVVTVNGNTTEPGPATLNAGTWTSLNLYPTGIYTISGNPNINLVLLWGADNVIIDGSIGGIGATRDLTFSFTNTAGSTIRFASDASNNIIRNCIVKGCATSTTSGVIEFSLAFPGTGIGNNNNTISNCNIAPSTSLPTNGIYSSGTSTAVSNTGITISNCDIQDYFSATAASNGIFASTNNGNWTISGNRFFQTATRTFTAGVQHTAINIGSPANGGFQVLSNIIGFNSSSSTPGTYSVFTGAFAGRVMGIELNASSASVSEIQGNTIAGIQLTSASTANLRIFTGISILNISRANIGTTTGNIIGAGTGTNSITISSTAGIPEIDGIYVSSTSSCDIRNNTIGAINTASLAAIGHTFRGIYVSGTGPNSIINNTIGNGTANSISVGVAGSTTGINTFHGIYNTSSNTATLSGNEVQNAIVYNTSVASEMAGIYNYNVSGNITNNNIHHLTTNTTSGSASLFGIWQNSFSAGSTSNIYNNQIHDLSTINTLVGAASALSGINSQGGSLTTANFYSNKIYSLSSTTIGTGTVSGITVFGGTTYNIYNNYIGHLTTTAASSASPSIMGIRFFNANPTNLNVYFNTIYLNATSTGANFSTAGIYHTSAAALGMLNLRNNIIVNTSTPSATGRTAALYRSAANLGNYIPASNNNLFYAGVPGPNRFIYYDGTGYQTLATFQALVTPRELASVTEDPPFTNRIDPTQTNYLHFSNICGGTATQVESGGVRILVPAITTDFDTDLRWGETGYTGGGSAPDIGADEFDVSAIEVTATAGVLGPTNYSTLKGAFDRINDGTHQGAITIRVLCSTIEPVTAVLNASGSGSAFYASVQMYPAVTGLSITGDLDGSPLIELNGADIVTINGSLNGTGSATDLTISNLSLSNLAGTSTFRLLGDATGNQITYCNILGSYTGAAGTSGGTVLVTTGTVNGNDNNTITRNIIGPNGINLPSQALVFLGNTFLNTGNTVSENNIFDFFHVTAASAGVYIGNGTSDGNITDNRFYQTSARTQTTGTQHSAIWIANTSGNNYQVTGNTIGFAASLGTGSYTLVGAGNQPNNTKFFPIYLNVGTTTPTSVQGNTIAGISMSGNMSGTSDNSVFTGIYIFGGAVNIGDITGNTIGNMTSNGSITFTTNAASPIFSQVNGIYNTGGGNWVSNNNNIGGITISNSSTGHCEFYGLRGNIGTSNWTCQSNIIGGNIAGSLNNTATSTLSESYGIFNSSYAGTFSENTIRNIMTAGGTSAATYSTNGIRINITSGSNNQTIRNNTIYNLSNSNPALEIKVVGINVTGNGNGNLIERNFIHSLSNSTSNTTSIISGIRLNVGTNSLQNNIISLSNPTTGASVFGIQDTGGSNNLYHNTVSLTGNTTAATQDAAYYSTSGSTRNIRNNIFANVRTGGSAAHHAYNITNTTGLTLNFNDYVGDQTGTGGGANSVTTPPAFSNPAGTNAADYIPASPVNGTNTTGVATDYNNDARNCAFTMGAFEVEVNVGTPVFTLGATSTRCQGAGSVTYTATAANTTGITYNLDAASIAGGVTINAATGEVTYPAAWSGTTTITASAAGCNGPETATHTVTINPALPVSVSIAADQNPICAGTNVTFTATPTNGGAAPAYQWYLNGNPVGANSNTYSNNTLANNDQVYVVLTSDETCTSGNPATSNTVTMTVNPTLPVSVSIAADQNPICAGTNVTFTATPTNGGTTPAYQWFLNGNPVGVNSNTYSNNALANNDQVYVVLTSNETCT
ncbi:MAG: hypothetical protein FD166_3602, partial [Bacteroidetes bacterium]